MVCASASVNEGLVGEEDDVRLHVENVHELDVRIARAVAEEVAAAGALTGGRRRCRRRTTSTGSSRSDRRR
jgi:hypothetical protein